MTQVLVTGPALVARPAGRLAPGFAGAAGHRGGAGQALQGLGLIAEASPIVTSTARQRLCAFTKRSGSRARFRLPSRPAASYGHRATGSDLPQPWNTTWQGLYQRSAAHPGKSDFQLPQRWKTARAKLDPKTPLNFVTTLDMAGGSSGSPLDRKSVV